MTTLCVMGKKNTHTHSWRKKKSAHTHTFKGGKPMIY